jgi:hypothetical protein
LSRSYTDKQFSGCEICTSLTSGLQLRTLFFLTSLLGITMAVHSASDVPAVPAGHPLTGTWSWTLFGGGCTETYQYRVNRTVLATSGQEVSEKKYEITPTPDAAGFFKLVETVIRQNEKKDCSGTLSEGPGEQTIRYIQFSPKQDKLIVCEDASLKACFGPLIRIP